MHSGTSWVRKCHEKSWCVLPWLLITMSTGPSITSSSPHSPCWHCERVCDSVCVCVSNVCKVLCYVLTFLGFVQTCQRITVCPIPAALSDMLYPHFVTVMKEFSCHGHVRICLLVFFWTGVSFRQPTIFGWLVLMLWLTLKDTLSFYHCRLLSVCGQLPVPC